MRIFYWGPHLSGLRTSFAAAIGHDSRAIYKMEGDRDNAVDIAGHECQLRFSGPLTSSVYKGPAPIFASLEALEHTDGIMFVADSQPERGLANTALLHRLEAALAWMGRDIDQVPIMFCLNKRDLANLMTVEEMKANLRTGRCDYVETIATKRVGTTEALERLVRLWSPG